jgi:hypothetical protein
MDGGVETARSLRDIFASMSHGSADPAAALAEAGHGDLPSHLVTEAIVNYADSAPVEVAEHLTPFVVANSAVPAPVSHAYPVTDLHDGLSLLASAPDPVHTGAADHLPGHDDPFGMHHDLADHPSVLDDVPHLTGHLTGVTDHTGDHAGDQAADRDAHHGDDGAHTDLWFGHGQATALAPQLDAGALGEGTGTHHYAEAAHTDPWLDVHAGLGHDAVPGHEPTGLTLWDEHVDSHDTGSHDAAPAAHPLPVEDPADHDLPIDPGHA